MGRNLTDQVRLVEGPLSGSTHPGPTRPGSTHLRFRVIDRGRHLADYLATAETEINATPARVWAALTDPALIKRYMFGSLVVTDWQQGSPILWKGEYEGRVYEDKGEIVEIEPQRRLKVTSARWAARRICPRTTAPSSTSSPRGGTTHLSLSQDKNTSEAEAEHSKSMWAMMLAGLKEVVEGG